MTPRIARAEYSTVNPKTKRVIEEHHVIRLVVVDGDLCSVECPHRVPTQGCNGFYTCGTAPVIEGPYRGRAWRGQECMEQATRDSETRARRAYERLIALRGRKVDMTKTAKKETKPVKADDTIETRKDVRHLKVTLTRDELEERADRSSHVWAEHCATETEMKTIAANYKAKIAELRGKHDVLEREIRDKCTYRDIECSIEYDYNTRKVTARRNDTGETVEERDMLNEEFIAWQAKRKQTKLPFGESKAPDAESTEELNKEADNTESELKARAKRQKKNG